MLAVVEQTVRIGEQVIRVILIIVRFFVPMTWQTRPRKCNVETNISILIRQGTPGSPRSEEGGMISGSSSRDSLTSATMSSKSFCGNRNETV
ncbi:hypothetical protein DPMN_044498 [Dreissena polymorpha]|uniref:Uncharacterized protein n=1 Tax=Dreissena polymorpha TaxID=45954 RepID=A0A9D4D4J3_DREPO|nr:hypothetical protein DPMN_044498 [Dreissena polymorpha]